MVYSLSTSIPCWVNSTSCGCGKKSYLTLPRGFIVWVRYSTRDEYSVDIYVNSQLVHGEVVNAIDLCHAREKAMCILGSFLGDIINSLTGVNPRSALEEA